MTQPTNISRNTISQKLVLVRKHTDNHTKYIQDISLHMLACVVTYLSAVRHFPQQSHLKHREETAEA